MVKPGQVAVEYMEGKRTRNLKPVQFYVFASTVFFLLLFYMVNVKDWNASPGSTSKYKKRLFNLEQEKKLLKGTDDTTYVNFLTQSIKATLDSIHQAHGDTSENNIELNFSAPYDTNTTDTGWFAQLLEKRTEERSKEIEEKHEGDQMGALADFMNEIFHKTPQLLFLSMPFFAFFLKLLYIRSSRSNYVEHFIFSVYHYAYLFAIMSIYLVIDYLVEKSANETLLTFTDYLTGGLVLYTLIYLLLSMKRFYRDRWRYLIPRYMILMFLSFITILVLFLIIILVIYLL